MPPACHILSFEPLLPGNKKEADAFASASYGAGDEARFIFAFGKNQGVSAVQPAKNGMPPACHILSFEPLLPGNKKEADAKASASYGAGDEARFIFAFGKNQGVSAVEPAENDMPPACHILSFEPLLPGNKS